MNKRGSISVYVMVVGTIFLYCALLLMLSVNTLKVQDNFKEVSSYAGVYSQKMSLENSIFFVLVENFLNGTQNVLTENSERIGYESIDFNKKMNTELDLAIKNLKKEPGDSVFGKFLQANEISENFDGENASFYVKGWKTSVKQTDASGNEFRLVDYTSDLNAKVSFKMLGLLSFVDIKNKYCGCLKAPKVDNIKNCFANSFDKFNVNFENQYASGVISTSSNNGEDGFGMGSNENKVVVATGNALPLTILVKLKSKDKYYIDQDTKELSFNLKFDNFADGSKPSNLAFCPPSVGSVIFTS